MKIRLQDFMRTQANSPSIFVDCQLMLIFASRVSGIRVSYLDWGAFSHGLFLQAPSKQRKEKSTNQCSTILTYCTCVCNSVLPLSRWGTESWLEDKKLEPCTSLDQPSLPQGACVCVSVCLCVCVSVYVYVVCMYVRTCV